MDKEESNGGKERGLSFEAPSSLRGFGEEAYWYAKTEKIGHGIVFILRKSSSSRVAERIFERTLELIEVSSYCVRDQGLRDEFFTRLLELSTLLRIASTGGEISQENAGIISFELAKLSDRVALRINGGVPTSLFSVGQLEDSFEKRGQERALGGLFGGGSAQGNVQKAERVPVEGKIVKRTSSNKGQASAGESPRSQLILSIVKEKGEASIRDIAALVEGCSEKTIQRELASLVEQGYVKRKGERRWSLYSPA